MKNKIIGTSLALLGTFTLCLFAATNAPAAERVSLFDGKTLDGWDVLTCEAVVENGCIFLKGGNGIVQSKKKYADYVLEFEWKGLKEEKYDSGVYFRYDTIVAPRPWPKNYQANMRQDDEGNVGGLEGAKSKGLFKKGEWNFFKMTVRGTKVEMEINGKPAWKADGLQGPKEGFIGLQAEIPGGGQCLFRNIYITELK